jgi:hypothetical protein
MPYFAVCFGKDKKNLPNRITALGRFLLEIRLFLWFRFRQTEINISVQKLTYSDERGFRKLLIKTGNLNLLAVLKDFFEVIGRSGKLFKFAVQLFLHFKANLVGTF